ncbi:cilia- and flagella-associated protein 57-like [Hemibagrus wyckioides]|uniref:cilia- and flagella-associated protein 57-like n=1 Tax=Hemibagrus wyckioides TaxID=337641 RepID=UPI00266BA98C|nr:cilia- and flagella-associated protein 57-like [Hemibagrus wyckioides]
MKDKGATPQNTMKDKEATPQNTMKDKEATPQNAMKDKGATPQNAMKDKGATPQNTMKDKEATPQNAMKDKGATPQNTSRQTTQTQMLYRASPYPPNIPVALGIKIEPHHIFGLCREARNNLHFLDEETIVFPSGNNCVLYNVHQQQTNFIPGAMPYQMEKQAIKALAISSDRCFLAVSERGVQSTVSVYDIKSDQCYKMQVLRGGDFNVKEFVCMAFSADSKYLLCQGGGPDWILFYWDWETDEVIATVDTTRLGFVSQVSFNPVDNTQICVSGKYVFTIYQLEKDRLKKISTFKMDRENNKSHAWLSEDSIVFGTETGKLKLLKDGEFSKNDPSSTAVLPCISAVMAYSKGFAYASRLGEVCLYEKIEYGYMKVAEIRIPQDPCSNEPSLSAQQEIKSMCLSPSEETLAISTQHGQIYHVNLASVEISQNKQANFEYLFHSLHSGSITGLSVSSSKHLFATCSKDNSVRIWNYKTNSLELHKEFPEEPNCISLHPNGLSILVGFSDKVCLMNLLVDEFCTVQEFDIQDCSECVFNHDGTMFAAVRDNLISIISIRTGDKVDLNGHVNMVQFVKWSEDDRHLVSFGTDGAVYEWSVLGGECTLNESRDGEILRDLASFDKAYTAISMTHSVQAVFVGTAIGTVRVMQYPLEESCWTEYPAHSGPITKMIVTPDDQYLVTASEDGSLLIWTITDLEGHQLSTVKETCCTEEVLCSRAFLEKKDQTIPEAHGLIKLNKKLECKLNQSQTDYEKKHEESQKELLKNIEGLESQIEKLNIEKEERKISQEKALTEMREKHAKELEDMENKHAEETFQALKVQEDLKQKLDELHKDYGKNLRKEEDSSFCIMDKKQNMIQNEVPLITINNRLDELIEDRNRPTGETAETEIEQLKNRIKEKNLFFKQLKAEMEENNSRNKEVIHQLKEKLKVKGNELCTERQRVRNLKVLVDRMKADIQTCSDFIQRPKMLKENFIKLYKRYIKGAVRGLVEQILCLVNRRAVPTNDLYQEMNKIYRDWTQYSRTVKTDAHVRNSIANGRVALRDQFVEGVRDPSLRRELRKFVRDHPRCTMMDVRDEAQLWAAEESSASSKTSKSRYGSNMTQCSALRVQEKKPVTLEDVLDVVAEQGKAISELTQVVKRLSVRNSASLEAPRPRSQPKFTEDGQPICFRCQVAGHVAKNCPQRQSSRAVKPVSSDSQGNKSPQVVGSRAIQGGRTDSKDALPACDQLLQRAVGTCPVVELSIGGITTKGLLDTGSQMMTSSPQLVGSNSQQPTGLTYPTWVT